MIRILVVCSLVGWVGLTLVLHELRWFSRPTLTDRLAGHLPGRFGIQERSGVLSAASFRDAVGPLARALGERVGRIFGISEDLDRKLRRTHSDLDVTTFRVRQLSWAIAGLGAGGLFIVGARPGNAVGLVVLVGGAALAFLLVEQQAVAASDRWKRSLHLELPIVAEQLGMLIGAGYSLASALDRISQRGQGASARDLRRAMQRVRQGVDVEIALREWAELSDVEAVERFVAVLSLNREATDLGRLIAEEARSIRRDVQRELIETMEQRAQQVWIPVTVATLIPGVIFIAIPFTQALQELNL